MRKILIKKVNTAAFGRSHRKTFAAAVRVVAACVGARRINVTPISIFNRHHVALFKRIRAGSVEVVIHRGEPFVILGMNQVLALVADQSMGRASATEMLAGLSPVLPSTSVPRHARSRHGVPRLRT